MLRIFSIDAAAGRAEEVDPSDLAAARRASGWIWVDAVGLSRPSIEAVCAEFGFDTLAVEDVLTPTGSPKADDYEDHTFVVLHGLADDGSEFRTVEYDLFVGPDYLVVFRNEELPGLSWVRDQIVMPGHRLPEGPDRLFARMAETGGTRFGALADALEEHTDGLEDHAAAGNPAVIGEIQGLRRDALRLRRVLIPQRGTIRHLSYEDHPAFGERARMRMRSALDLYERAAESTEGSRAMLGIALETYRASVAERANEVMKVLTVFAAIMLPLTFMAGVYGMNFSNMPELGWTWAYPAALGLMATVGISLWAYFGRRGFIGGPRISKLPRAVGAGLAGLVRATTKPMGLIGHHPSEGKDDPGS